MAKVEENEEDEDVEDDWMNADEDKLAEKLKAKDIKNKAGILKLEDEEEDKTNATNEEK